LVLSVLLVSGGGALAQVEIERPTGGYTNAVGLFVFVGPNITAGTHFYGVAAEYTRLLTSKWELATSVGADWVQSKAGHEHSVSFSLTAGYLVTERLSADLTYATTFAQNGPRTHGSWAWANGDSAIGVGVSYTLWEAARHSLSASLGLDRNVTAAETSINFALGYAFSF
jgi:hypothetical protein